MNHSSIQTIGLIGLGLVGSALINRFHQSGFAVIGYDVDPAQSEKASNTGVRIVSSPKEIINHTSLIVLSLPNSQIVREVLFGEQGIAINNPETLTIIDTTTGDPDDTVAIANKLVQSGNHYMDACLIGSSTMIDEGVSVIVCGGSKQLIDECNPVLSSITEKIYRVGEAGKGMQAKLVVNLVLGLNRLVLSEGLIFAQHLGLDQNSMLDILQSGAAYSKVMDTKGKKMLDGDFTPQARLQQHLKDVRLILSQAESLGIKLPLSTIHESVLQTGVDSNLGELDNSAVIQALRNFITH